MINYYYRKHVYRTYDVPSSALQILTHLLNWNENPSVLSWIDNTSISKFCFFFFQILF